MRTDISQRDTADLLQLSRSEDDEDLAHQALWTVLKRWEAGIDVSLLIDLISSAAVSERLRASDYLYEVSPRVDSVKDVVIKLADDVLAECRAAFVAYLINSGWYGDTAAEGLVRCIHDFDLRVRLKAIDWAILTTDERFEDFASRMMVDFNTPSRNPWTQRIKKRGLRALAIARCLRDGESVAQTRAAVPEDDSLTFDHLSVFESHYERQRKRRYPPDGV